MVSEKHASGRADAVTAKEEFTKTAENASSRGWHKIGTAYANYWRGARGRRVLKREL